MVQTRRDMPDSPCLSGEMTLLPCAENQLLLFSQLQDWETCTSYFTWWINTHCCHKPVWSLLITTRHTTKNSKNLSELTNSMLSIKHWTLLSKATSMQTLGHSLNSSITNYFLMLNGALYKASFSPSKARPSTVTEATPGRGCLEYLQPYYSSTSSFGSDIKCCQLKKKSSPTFPTPSYPPVKQIVEMIQVKIKSGLFFFCLALQPSSPQGSRNIHAGMNWVRGAEVGMSCQGGTRSYHFQPLKTQPDPSLMV